MKFGNKIISYSVQDRLIAVIIAMILAITLIASPMSAKAPGVAPVMIQCFGLVLLIAMVCVKRWNIRTEAVRSLLLSGTSIAALSFFALSLLSCLFSHNRSVSFQGSMLIGTGVLVYLVVAYQFRHSIQISRLSDALAIVAVVAAIFGFVDYGYSEVGSRVTAEAAGLFGDHQLSGSFLMLLLPFVAVSAMTEKVLNRQLRAQTATVLTIIALLLAHARSAWIGSAVGLIAVGVLCALFPPHGKKRDDKAQLVPAFLLVAGVGFFLIFSPITSSLLSRATTLTSVRTQDAWIDRQQIWHGALRLIADHPVTGIGPSMYAYSHHSYTRLGMPIGQMHLRPSLSDQTHNFYLQTAAEIGVPGLIALIVALVTFWIVAVPKLKTLDHGVRRNVLTGAIGATVAFAVDAFASPSWQFGQIIIFFWIALGIGVACTREIVPGESPRRSPQASYPAWLRRTAAASGILGAAALAPVAVLAAGQYPQAVYVPPTNPAIGPAVTGAAAAAAVAGAFVIAEAGAVPEAHLEIIRIAGTPDGTYEFRAMFFNGTKQSESVTDRPETTWSVSEGVITPITGTDLEGFKLDQVTPGTTVTVTATYKLGDKTYTASREIDIP